MKVLMINGSQNKNGCTYTALKIVALELERAGIATEIFHIGNKTVRGCNGCLGCSHSHRCLFSDDLVNECIEKLIAADGVVIGSPVYYAAPNGALCAFLDRMFFLKESLFAYKLGASVVSCRRGGASAAFDRLNKYFTISNMPIVSSQYWNSVHGSTPQQVLQDEEGMQIMRTLGRNMAWLLKCIDNSKLSCPHPVSEPWKRTDFIR